MICLEYQYVGPMIATFENKCPIFTYNGNCVRGKKIALWPLGVTLFQNMLSYVNMGQKTSLVLCIDFQYKI